MSTPAILKAFAAIYLVLILVDWLRLRDVRRFLFELAPLLGLIALDISIASVNAGYVTFGSESSPISASLIMFGAVLMGVIARYIFYLRGNFSWLDFAKPLCISPILLIPLVGSIQSVKSLEPMQVVSFALLAFQNGFFWQTVLQRTRPKR